MDFDLDQTQTSLVKEVDRVVASAPGDSAPRDVLRQLGDRHLLAVHYPERYGGRGLRLVDHGVVAERLGVLGLPDDAHLVSVQGVGCTLLVAGSDEQRARWLPEIATGRACASLLLSEVQAGTDLTAIGTVATEVDNGFEITGEKAWNLHADWSELGLCSALTRRTDGRPDGVTVFLVPFDAPGVSVIPKPRLLGEPYFTVAFDGVHVGPDAVVGGLHQGLPVMLRAVGFERAGFDYLARAQRWLRSAAAAVAAVPDAARRDNLRADLLRHERTVMQARSLAFTAVATADGIDMDDAASAYSKAACGEAAQDLAWWAAQALLEAASHDGSAELSHLRDALAEAPELSVSGGAIELLLDLICTELRTAV
jgi:alkylation response protein AidB-like acyl-CoA dehydrogenase